MASGRVEQAARQLETINNETELELQGLNNAIDEVEGLHEEHVKELELDEEFLNDLRTLFNDIRLVRQIDHHMQQVVAAYGNGEMSKHEFREAFIEDEERFTEVVEEIRTELEEMIRILSEEERLTNRDLDIEGATENLVRQLTNEEEQLEQSHRNLEQLISGE